MFDDDEEEGKDDEGKDDEESDDEELLTSIPGKSKRKSPAQRSTRRTRSRR